jgi:NADH:ubiquinone oxidoreductase subunit 6 (subunit J)
MSLRAHVSLAILVALAIVGIIVLVRRRHLKAKYSLLWLSLGAVMVVIAAVPGLLDWTAERLGIWYQPTLLILLGLALLLLIVVHFSYELTRSENRTRELAEQLALLRLRVTELQQSIDTADNGTDAGSDSASP